jgi:hypothetical protein
MPIDDYVGDVTFAEIKRIAIPGHYFFEKKLNVFPIHGNKKFKNFYADLRLNNPSLADFVLYKLSLNENLKSVGAFMIAHNIKSPLLRYHASGDSPSLREGHRSYLLEKLLTK